MFYQPIWYANPNEERPEDLAAAEMERGEEHNTFEAAKEEIIDTDPEQEAFVREYEVVISGTQRFVELIDEHDDPRHR